MCTFTSSHACPTSLPIAWAPAVFGYLDPTVTNATDDAMGLGSAEVVAV